MKIQTGIVLIVLASLLGCGGGSEAGSEQGHSGGSDGRFEKEPVEIHFWKELAPGISSLDLVNEKINGRLEVYPTARLTFHSYIILLNATDAGNGLYHDLPGYDVSHFLSKDTYLNENEDLLMGSRSYCSESEDLIKDCNPGGGLYCYYSPENEMNFICSHESSAHVEDGYTVDATGLIDQLPMTIFAIFKACLQPPLSGCDTAIYEFGLN